MNFAAVEPIVRAVLYEGYLLYPYRPTALKNRYRWLFGRLLPREFSEANDNREPWKTQSECILKATAASSISVRVRFLQLVDGPQHDQFGNSDTIERAVAAEFTVPELLARAAHVPFSFAGLAGKLTVAAVESGPELIRLTVDIQNVTPATAVLAFDEGLKHALLSTVTLLRIEKGEFISMIDPPSSLVPLIRSCQNVGTWPVLVGRRAGEMLMSAPIILYDYPQVAPESPGDSFDGTEIDELLALRIQTLTDAEKQAMAAAGEHTYGVLQRAAGLSDEQRLQLHGRLTISQPDITQLRPGVRVRLRPRHRADAFDMMLAGQQATIVAIEHDFENRLHLAVVVDEDPGKSLGIHGHPGHRFYYRPEEVELVS